MSTLHYRLVDVFTDHPYAGNPLAVVLDADDLTTEQLQAIAVEFNLSETAFPVQPSEEERAAGASYRLRIFTPRAELPFAGHPSVGAAWVLRALGRIPDGAAVQACGAGNVDVYVDAAGAHLTGARPHVGHTLDAPELLAAVSLPPYAGGAVDARTAGAGLDFAYVVVDGQDSLASCWPDLGRLSRLAGTARGGVSVTAWDAATATARTRVFAADLGVPEDPATGSAALGFGAYAVAVGLLPRDGEHEFTVVQGVEMGRPSTIRASVVARDGVAQRCTVAGGVVPVGSGELRRP